MRLFTRSGFRRHENTTAGTGAGVGKVSRDLIRLNMSLDSETQVQAAAPPRVLCSGQLQPYPSILPRVAGRPLER